MTTARHVELHRMQMFVIGTRVRKNDFEVRCASVARCAMEAFSRDAHLAVTLIRPSAGFA